jgi:O-antigen/teichoic acid export membrane protein
MTPDDGTPRPGPSRLARVTASDRTLLLKSSLTIASRVASKTAQLAWFVVAARLLSVDEFAQYGYVVSLALTFCVLGDAGVGTVVGREIASGHSAPGHAFWSAVPLVALVGCLVTVLFAGLLLIGSGPGVDAGSIAAAAAFILANRAFDLSSTSLRALGRIEFEAGLQLANAVLFVTLATVIAASGGTVTLVLLALAGKELASAAVAGVAIRRDVGHYVHVPLRRSLGMLASGLFMALASFGLSATTRVPLVVLGNLGSAAQVAYYSAAVRFADTAVTLSVTVGYGLLPGLANIQGRDLGRALRLVWRTLGTLAAVAAVVAVPLVLLRHQLAELTFGASFRPAGDPLGVFFSGLPVFAVTGVAWFALLALGRERTVFAAAWIGVVTSAVLSALLAGDPDGAAVAYVGGVTAIAGGLLVSLARHGLAYGAARQEGPSDAVHEALATYE